MKLVSKVEGGGYSAAVQIDIPRAGVEFEVDEVKGAELLAIGLAEPAKKKAATSAKKEE